MSENQNSLLLTGVGVLAGVVGLATVGYLLGAPAEKEKSSAGGGGGGGGGGFGEGGLDEDAMAQLLQTLMASQGAAGGGSPKSSGHSKGPASGGRGPRQPGPSLLKPALANKAVGAASAGPVQPASQSAFGDVMEYSPQDRLQIRLQQQIQIIFGYIEKGEKDYARELVDPCLLTAAECFGEESETVISLAVRFSKVLHDPSILQKMFDEHIESKGENFKLLWTVGILLSEMYEGDDEELSENPEQIIANNLKLMEVLIKNPKYKDPYLLVAEQTLNHYRTLGHWKTITELVTQVRSAFAHSPLSLRQIIEQQVGSFHQEGKTEAAIAYLNSYLEAIKDLPESSSTIVWCHQRMSKFEFYMDGYENSCKHLLIAYETKQKNSLETYGLLSDLISVYVELGQDAKAHEAFQQLTHERHLAELARSKYLLTTAAQLDTKYYLYLKVCRVRPHRAEGEKDPEENEYERKLENFFLEVTYPDPHGKEPIIVEESIDHHDIELTSPAFPTAATPGTWHLVKIAIYKDGSKTELLGRHWQPVFATRTATRKPRMQL